MFLTPPNIVLLMHLKLRAKLANIRCYIAYVPLFSEDLYDQWDSVSFRHHRISASRVFAGIRPRCSRLLLLLLSRVVPTSLEEGVGAASGSGSLLVDG